MIGFRYFTALILFIVLGAATTLFYHQEKTEPAPIAVDPERPTAPSTTRETFDTKEVQPLPLAEKVGQLFMIGHWADASVASTTALIATHQLGGVVVMSAPATTTDIRQWVHTWQASSTHPLLLAIDQEGGPVSRLTGEEYVQTSQREVTSTSTAFALGQTRGRELRALGLNMNFAPVLDTATNSESFMYARSFPDRAASPILAAAMIAGMADTGVVGVVKHFPGHADTAADSHEILPDIPLSREELDEHTKPFRTLIAHASPRAFMTAHVRFPTIDSEPVTLSHFFLTEYLRTELDFSGVVITDDLSMTAIASSTPTALAAVQALGAGADMVLFAAEPATATAAIAAVLDAVEDGRLSEAHIDESFARVSTLKQTLVP